MCAQFTKDIDNSERPAGQSCNPHFFIVGCPRSGTTLLERIVNAHPELAVIHETHWITRLWRKRTGIDHDGFVTEDILDAITTHHRFGNLKMSRSDVEALMTPGDPLSYADLVSRLFDHFGASEQKSIVGDKTTGSYIRHIPTLHTLWPNAKIIHLIRDGRDVCLSMLKWPKAERAAGRSVVWPESPVAATALWWKWHVESGRSGCDAIGNEHTLELRFEDLVRDTEAVATTLCAFLGVDYSDDMMQFNEGKTRPEPNLSPNQAWLAPTPGLRDWRTQMPGEDRQLFEQLAGEFLDTLGYEVDAAAPSPEIEREAARFTSLWEQQRDGSQPAGSKPVNSKASEPATKTTQARDGHANGSDSANPFVFVVGCPRSGTTLLQRMLNSHPQLAVANDTHFIPRVLNRLKLNDNTEITPELVQAVQEYRRFPRLGLDAEQVVEAAQSAATYADLVAALYTRFAAKHGKPFGGEKTPDYARHLPLLANLFPHAKLVHIIRDGRDVALSALEWAHGGKGPGRIELWQEEPIAVCAMWWKRNVGMGRRDGAALGEETYAEIIYEDLVAHPRESMKAMAKFLGLPYEDAMLEFHVGKRKHGAQLSAKSAWLPPTAGLRNWRDQMSERDIELFEALAGDMLTEIGYERSVSTVSPAIAETAQRCSDWWNSRRWERQSGWQNAAVQ